MKEFWSYCSKVFIVSIILAGLFVYFFGQKTDQDGQSISPLPEFLTLRNNEQATLLDFWLPMIQQTHGNRVDPPALTAKSILMYDLSTDKTIYEKNATTRRPMASLTKIMTAIVSIENPRTDDKYYVKEENLVGEDSMGLESGEILSLDELLYGLMLPSGNDAAEVLATNYPAGRAAFIKAMNDKAKALGLSDTQFSNPSGLQGDGIQHTTAYDLLVITRYAMETYPRFKDIVSQPAYSLPATDTHKGYELFNETNLLTTYAGVKGVKTGYTPEAGMCLITYMDYNGHEIIGIILNSENRRIEMKELLDFSLKSLGIEPPEYTG